MAPTHRIGECRVNLSRIGQARVAVNEAEMALDRAFTQWTNRTDAPDETTDAAKEAQRALIELSRQLAGDARVWTAYQVEAAEAMEARRAATVAAKAAKGGA